MTSLPGFMLWFMGPAYQQNQRIRLPRRKKKKGGVAIEPAFIGKSAYSRKAGVLIL